MKPADTWNNLWHKYQNINIDQNSWRIFEQICDHINLKGKKVLELGAGAGRLSYLILKNGAESVTLVDYSNQALKHAKKLFGRRKKVNFIASDLFDFSPRTKYDLVFSSGLIEHYRGKKFSDCLKKHFDLSSDLVIFVVPASPHYNDLRAKMKKTIKDFGWQKPIKAKKMERVCQKFGSQIILNKRFHTFYGIRFLSILSLPKAIDQKIGGLLITICQKRKKYE